MIADSSFANDFPLDLHFARLLCRLENREREEPALFLAACAASRCNRQGHICADLALLADEEVSGFSQPPVRRYPDLALWIKILRKSRVVGRPGQYAPLILDEAGRLYLQRYWQYEKDAAFFLRHRLSAYASGGRPDLYPPVPPSTVLQKALKRMFPEPLSETPDLQRLAALLAAVCPICIVSGSPGTGKTTAAAKMLALLLETAGPAAGTRIALAAPTGKAAGRLKQAIFRGMEFLKCPDWVKEAMPREASTLHRLLGFSPQGMHPHHDRSRPLALDVLVIDEASLVDLPLMTKTMEALLPTARLILLGDKDQLASVEAGAILGDLCNAGPMNLPTDELRSALGGLMDEILPDCRRSGGRSIGDGLVQFEKNFRFGNDSTIGRISKAVRCGNSEEAIRCLKTGSDAGIRWRVLPAPEELPSALKEAACDGFHPYLREIRSGGDIGRILECLDRFRILCAVRHGPYGVLAVNSAVERALRFVSPLDSGGSAWYVGRPIMILRNDYDLGLFNGDVGVVMPASKEGTQPFAYAHFRDEDGAIRSFDPLGLPEHETVYATTVHKSQGSEYEQALFILPDRDVPVLTRELIYTALTRVRNKVEVWARDDILCGAISRKTVRLSGLSDGLRGPWERPATTDMEP